MKMPRALTLRQKREVGGPMTNITENKGCSSSHHIFTLSITPQLQPEQPRTSEAVGKCGVHFHVEQLGGNR